MSYHRRKSFVDGDTLAKDQEILGLPTDSRVERLRNAIDPARNVLPNNPLPTWRDYPLEKKFPVVPAPKGHFAFSRNVVGNQIFVAEPDQDFDNDDPYIRTTPKGYEALHDPHLKGFFSRHPKMYDALVEKGLVEKDGAVNTNMPDFNTFRAYLGRLRNSKVNDDLKFEDGIKKSNHDQIQKINKLDRIERQAAKEKEKRLFLEALKREKERRQIVLQMKPRTPAYINEERFRREMVAASEREAMREKVRNRLAKLRRAERRRARRILLEWYCRQFYADMMRNARMQMKKDLKKEDLKSFIKSKKEFQEVKSKYVNALQERKKAERECRINKRRIMVDNMEANRIENNRRRAQEEEDRCLREIELLRKFGMRWLNYVRSQKTNAQTYHDSVWRVRKQLMEMVAELKKESGKVSFTNFIQGLVKMKPGRQPMPKMNEETRLTMNYILDLLIQAAFDTYKETNHPCKTAYEKLANRRRILGQPNLGPEDFMAPKFQLRDKPHVNLARSVFPCDHICVGVKPHFKEDPCCVNPDLPCEEEAAEEEAKVLADDELKRLLKKLGTREKKAVQGIRGKGRESKGGAEEGETQTEEEEGPGEWRKREVKREPPRSKSPGMKYYAGEIPSQTSQGKKRKKDEGKEEDDRSSSGVAEKLVTRSLTHVTSAVDPDFLAGKEKTTPTGGDVSKKKPGVSPKGAKTGSEREKKGKKPSGDDGGAKTDGGESTADESGAKTDESGGKTDDSGVKADGKGKAGAGPMADGKTKTDGTKADSKAKTDGGAKADSKAKADGGAKADSKAKADWKTKDDGGPKADRKSKADGGPKADSKTKADGVPKIDGSEKSTARDDAGGSSSGMAEDLVAKSLTQVARKGLGDKTGKEGGARSGSGSKKGLGDKSDKDGGARSGSGSKKGFGDKSDKDDGAGSGRGSKKGFGDKSDKDGGAGSGSDLKKGPEDKTGKGSGAGSGSDLKKGPGDKTDKERGAGSGSDLKKGPGDKTGKGSGAGSGSDLKKRPGDKTGKEDRVGADGASKKGLGDKTGKEGETDGRGAAASKPSKKDGGSSSGPSTGRKSSVGSSDSLAERLAAEAIAKSASQLSKECAEGEICDDADGLDADKKPEKSGVKAVDTAGGRQSSTDSEASKLVKQAIDRSKTALAKECVDGVDEDCVDGKIVKGGVGSKPTKDKVGPDGSKARVSADRSSTPGSSRGGDTTTPPGTSISSKGTTSTSKGKRSSTDSAASDLVKSAIERSKTAMAKDCVDGIDEECEDGKPKGKGSGKLAKDKPSSPGTSRGGDTTSTASGTTPGTKGRKSSTDSAASNLVQDAIEKSKTALAKECAEGECDEDGKPISSSSKAGKDTRPDTATTSSDRAATATSEMSGSSAEAQRITTKTLEKCVDSLECKDEEVGSEPSVGADVGVQGSKTGIDSGVGGKVPGQDSGVGGTVPGQDSGVGGTVPGQDSGVGGTVPGQDTGVGGKVPGQDTAVGGMPPGKDAVTEKSVTDLAGASQQTTPSPQLDATTSPARPEEEERGVGESVPRSDASVQQAVPEQDVGTGERVPASDASVQQEVAGKDVGTGEREPDTTTGPVAGPSSRGRKSSTDSAAEDLVKAAIDKSSSAMAKECAEEECKDGTDAAVQKSVATLDAATERDGTTLDEATQQSQVSLEDKASGGVGQDEARQGESIPEEEAMARRKSREGQDAPAAEQAKRPSTEDAPTRTDRPDMSTSGPGISPRSDITTTEGEEEPTTARSAVTTDSEAAGTADSSTVAEIAASEALKKSASSLIPVTQSTMEEKESGPPSPHRVGEESDAASSSAAEDLVSKCLENAEGQQDEECLTLRGLQSQGFVVSTPSQIVGSTPSEQGPLGAVESETSADAINAVKESLRKAIKGLSCDEGDDGGLEDLMDGLEGFDKKKQPGGPEASEPRAQRRPDRGPPGPQGDPTEQVIAGGESPDEPKGPATAPGSQPPDDPGSVSKLLSPTSSIIAQEAVEKAMQRAKDSLKCEEEADSSEAPPIPSGGTGDASATIISSEEQPDSVIEEIAKAIAESTVPIESIGRSEVLTDVETLLEGSGSDPIRRRLSSGGRRLDRSIPSDTRESVLNTLSNVQNQLDAIRHELQQYGVVREPRNGQQRERRDTQ